MFSESILDESDYDFWRDGVVRVDRGNRGTGWVYNIGGGRGIRVTVGENSKVGVYI